MHVFECVVHPAHIPFEIEAESIRRGDTGEGGGFFRDGDCVGELFVDDLVEAAHEFDGFDVFAATEAVGYPFAIFAGEVEVDHGGDGVNAEAVEMVFVEPEESAVEKELADFGTAVIKYQCSPVRMLSL